MTKIYLSKLNKDKKEDIRVTRTKRDLGAALLKLLDTKNFDDITVKEICETALISKLTFYNNFLNKNSLMIYVFQSATMNTLDDLRKTYFDSVSQDRVYREVLASLINMFYSEESKLRKIIANDKNKSLYSCLYQFLKELIPEIIIRHNKEMADKVPTEIISSYYAGALTGLLYSLAGENFDVSDEQMTDYIYTLTTSKIMHMPNLLFDEDEI